jgi:hypothetical protein
MALPFGASSQTAFIRGLPVFVAGFYF